MGTALSTEHRSGGDFTPRETEIAAAMTLCPRRGAKTPSARPRKVPHARKRLQEMLHPSFYSGLDRGLGLCFMVHTEIHA